MSQNVDLPLGMYITPMMRTDLLNTGGDLFATKGWNGVIFVHSGPYELGVFKFRISFAMKHPLTLPTVMFKGKQVYHPFVKFESGKLDVQSLFSNKPGYEDENYYSGQLIQCYDGFGKDLLHRISLIFHDRSLLKPSKSHPWI